MAARVVLPVQIAHRTHKQRALRRQQIHGLTQYLAQVVVAGKILGRAVQYNRIKRMAFKKRMSAASMRRADTSGYAKTRVRFSSLRAKSMAAYSHSYPGKGAGNSEPLPHVQHALRPRLWARL